MVVDLVPKIQHRLPVHRFDEFPPVDFPDAVDLHSGNNVRSSVDVDLDVDVICVWIAFIGRSDQVVNPPARLVDVDICLQSSENHDIGTVTHFPS